MLHCTVGTVFVIKNFINNRKKLRKRVSKSINKLQQLIRCIGKIRIILLRNRKKKAVKVFIYLAIKSLSASLYNKMTKE